MLVRWVVMILFGKLVGIDYRRAACQYNVPRFLVILMFVCNCVAKSHKILMFVCLQKDAKQCCDTIMLNCMLVV